MSVLQERRDISAVLDAMNRSRQLRQFYQTSTNSDTAYCGYSLEYAYKALLQCMGRL